MSPEMEKLHPISRALPENLTIDEVMTAVESDEGIGFCLHCGAEQGYCEPDARHYECEECSAREVFGAEEIIMMFGG